AHPRRVRVLHVGSWRGERFGHARRRDDRRGLPQDGPGDLGQGPGGRDDAYDLLHAAGELSRDELRRRTATATDCYSTDCYSDGTGEGTFNAPLRSEHVMRVRALATVAAVAASFLTGCASTVAGQPSA